MLGFAYGYGDLGDPRDGSGGTLCFFPGCRPKTVFRSCEGFHQGDSWTRLLIDVSRHQAISNSSNLRPVGNR